MKNLTLFRFAMSIYRSFATINPVLVIHHQDNFGIQLNNTLSLNLLKKRVLRKDYRRSLRLLNFITYQSFIFIT